MDIALQMRLSRTEKRGRTTHLDFLLLTFPRTKTDFFPLNEKSDVFPKIVAILLLEEKSFAHAMGHGKAFHGRDETKDYPDVSSQIMYIHSMTSAAT